MSNQSRSLRSGTLPVRSTRGVGQADQENTINDNNFAKGFSISLQKSQLGRPALLSQRGCANIFWSALRRQTSNFVSQTFEQITIAAHGAAIGSDAMKSVFHQSVLALATIGLLAS